MSRAGRGLVARTSEEAAGLRRRQYERPRPCLAEKFWRKFSDAAARLRDVSAQAQESNLLALQAAAFERTFFKKVVFSLATDAINAYIDM